MKHCFFFSLLCFLCSSCDTPVYETPARQTIEKLGAQFAPDRRVARWLIRDTMIAGKVVLSGETNLPEAKAALMDQLEALDISFVDRIELLPGRALEGRIYGLVNVSVANLRSEDKHWGEMASQALLGTPMKVLKKVREGWYLVQTPDGYLGYMDRGAFVLLNEEQFRSWQASSRAVYWRDYGFALQEPDPESQPVSDLVIGGLLQLGKSEQAFSKVIFPDGRTAYVPTADLRPLSSWLKMPAPSPEQLTETAKGFLGRPYLWGGTSGKGMDCSGFTKNVFFLHGLILQRDASQQVHTGIEVPTDSTLAGVEKGDFLFFGRKAGPQQQEKVTHVGIYLGEGLFIHSGDDNPGIRIQSLLPDSPVFAPHRRASFLRARRLWSVPGEKRVQRIIDSDFYVPNDQ